MDRKIVFALLLLVSLNVSTVYGWRSLGRTLLRLSHALKPLARRSGWDQRAASLNLAPEIEDELNASEMDRIMQQMADEKQE
ncbi:molecule against microbes A [Ciona intestinalis]